MGGGAVEYLADPSCPSTPALTGAAAVVFLLGDGARFTTGQTLVIDGWDSCATTPTEPRVKPRSADAVAGERISPPGAR